MKSELDELVDALFLLTKDSIQIREKAFKNRVKTHTWRPIQKAIEVLENHGILIKWDSEK